MAEGAVSGPCRDAGASANDDVIKFVWLLLRASHCLDFFANVCHVLLCFSLHAAGLRMALTKVFCGALVLGAAALASVTGKSRVYELQATTVIWAIAQCAVALCMLFDNAEWTMYDISFIFIWRAFHGLAVTYWSVVLGFLDKKETRSMLVACRGAAVVVVACMIRKSVSAHPVFSIVYICGVVTHTLAGLLINKTSHFLRKERDLLKQVRDRLQQHVDCQDSMWRSVFDATLLCDSTGCAVSASAQAVDLLQYEAADAVVGQAVSGLAAPEEQSRISRFLKDVVSSPSSQAMTIQGTFLKKDQTPVELQINAVRVLQDICGSSSEGAFGILIGTRLVEAPREEHPAMPPDHRPPQTGAAEVSSYPDSEDMWIAFDAGTEHFGIIDCSPELCFEGQHLGLQSLFPPTASKSLETWMVDEVAACGELGGTASSIIERFHLRLPAAPARSIVAEQAWLEVLPTEVDQDGDLSLPAVLWLRGVACRRWSRSRDGKKPAKLARLVKQQLTSILENGDGDAPGKLVEQQSVVGSDEITPSDSASEKNLKFLVRRLDEGVDETVAVSEQFTPSDGAPDGISAPSRVGDGDEADFDDDDEESVRAAAHGLGPRAPEAPPRARGAAAEAAAGTPGASDEAAAETPGASDERVVEALARSEAEAVQQEQAQLQEALLRSKGDALTPAVDVVVLKYNHMKSWLRDALLSGPGLQEERGALEAAGFGLVLRSGAKLLVPPGVFAEVAEFFDGWDLKSSHVLVAAAWEAKVHREVDAAHKAHPRRETGSSKVTDRRAVSVPGRNRGRSASEASISSVGPPDTCASLPTTRPACGLPEDMVTHQYQVVRTFVHVTIPSSTLSSVSDHPRSM